jgi:hypothetical protein
MKIIADLHRAFSKARFRLLDLATIQDIPTARFNVLAGELRDCGWRNISEYDGFDAWVDYGRITLRRGRRKLTLEWDNWTEGSVEGPRAEVESIAATFGFAVSYQWRWAEYDKSSAPAKTASNRWAQ